MIATLALIVVVILVKIGTILSMIVAVVIIHVQLLILNISATVTATPLEVTIRKHVDGMAVIAVHQHAEVALNTNVVSWILSSAKILPQQVTVS
jgi:hypothetical protein